MTNPSSLAGTWPGEDDDGFEESIDKLRHPERGGEVMYLDSIKRWFSTKHTYDETLGYVTAVRDNGCSLRYSIEKEKLVLIILTSDAYVEESKKEKMDVLSPSAWTEFRCYLGKEVRVI